MNQSHLAALDRLLSTQRTQIHEKWVEKILTSWSTLLPNTFDVVEVRQHTSHLLEEIAKIFSAYPGYGLWEFGETHPLVRIMSEFSASCAQGLKTLQVRIACRGDYSIAKDDNGLVI